MPEKGGEFIKNTKECNTILKECYAQYRIKLFNYCLARLDGAREDADDCVQDSFLVLQQTVFYTDGSSERLSVRNDGLIEIDIPGLRVINTAISFDEGNMIINIADKDYELGAYAKKAGAFLNTIELISIIRKDILGSISFVVMLSFLGDFEAASDEIRYSIADEIRMYKAAL